MTNDSKFNYNLVATATGNYQLCITNGHKVAVNVNFQIESSAEAIDYENIVQKQHLKPIELQTKKIVDKIEKIRKQLGNLVIGEERLKETNSKIKFRVVVLGFISVTVMAVTTFLQVTYLKKFFRNKKIM